MYILGMLPTDTRRKQTFITLFIVYTSHFSPVIKNDTQMRFHRLLNNLKDILSFDPKDYSVANESNTKSFFTEYVFRTGFFSVTLDSLDVLGMVRPKKPLIKTDELVNIDELYNLLNNQKDKFFKSFFTIEMMMGALQTIHPEVVSMLACSYNGMFSHIEKLNKRIDESTSAIDRRNTEIKLLKTNLSEERSNNEKLAKEILDLDHDLQARDIKIDRLKNLLEHSKKQVDAQSIRKQRLKYLKDKIDRLVAANPESARLDELEEANKHFEELLGETPCCRVTYESLPELKIAGKKVMTTKCGHIFTDTIIKDYVAKNRKCPMCRERLSTTDIFYLFY